MTDLRLVGGRVHLELNILSLPWNGGQGALASTLSGRDLQRLGEFVDCLIYGQLSL